jgi:hypothetical protein
MGSRLNMNLPAGIIFEDSYVLKLEITPYSLDLTMDFELLREHPAYIDPKKGERACFKHGTLKIVKFTKLTWSVSGLAPATDANQEIDWGCLDEFSVSNCGWRLAGDWGAIDIEGGALEIVWAYCQRVPIDPAECVARKAS